MKFDIAIIGGGPGGYVAAIKASQLGKNVVLIEKGALGGTCLNAGCIPTKVLLKSIDIYQEVCNSKEFGIQILGLQEVKLSLSAIQERKKKIISQLVGGVNSLLIKNKVTILKGKATFVDRNNIKVEDQIISAENIIIATGSKVKELPVEKEEGSIIYTSDDILNMINLPNEIAIIGGGVIGIELAYYLAGAGVKVKIIEFLEQILPMVDEEIAQMVEEQFVKMGVEVYTSSKVTSIKKGKIIFVQDGIKRETKCDSVLIAVGRCPYFEELNLDAAGIATERGAIITNEQLETNINGIYAIGDVNGKSMLAHTASEEAVVAVENICGYKRKMDYSHIPSAIYIQPEVGSVGLTEKEARSRYRSIKVGRFPMMASGKAMIEGKENGLVKVIVQGDYDEVVGAQLYCPHATDMITEITAFLGLEATAEEIIKTIHLHPTISEAIHEAFLASVGKAIHY